MTKELKNVISLSLYPLLDSNGNHYDGILESINPICSECKTMECIQSLTLKDFEYFECHEGLLSFKVTVFSKSFLLYGLKNSYSDLNRFEKKNYPDRRYFKNLAQIQTWKNKVGEIYNNYLDEKEQLEKQDSILIHDIKKTNSTIYRKIENYILTSCEDSNKNLDNCINNANPDIVGIYKAVSLLTYQLGIIDYISNPDAVTYGQKKPIKIYKVIDKLVRIFQAHYSSIRFKLEGTSHNQLYLYDSFIALVFIILDNAKKYSLDNQDIIVKINDLGSDVEVSISSFSPYLSEESKKNIFKKYYREHNHKEGQGIGLYLADIISRALQANIVVNSSPIKASYNGIDYAEVEFKFYETSLK